MNPVVPGAATGSLMRKMLLPLLLAGAAGAVAAIWMTERRTEQQLAEQLRQRAELAANMLNYAAEVISRPGELQRIVTAIGADRDILDIVVAGGHPARVLASTKGVWLGKPLAELPAGEVADDLREAIRKRASHHHFNSAQHRFDFSAPLLLSHPELSDGSLSDGAVMLHLDTRPMEAALRQETLRQIAVTLLRLILLAALGYALIQWFLLRPIAAIGRAITLGRGAGDAAWARAATGDEIGALAATLRESLTRTDAAHRELARERLALANVIEGTNVGTWEWNVETGETRFNERWAQMIGYTLEELGPTSIDTWSRFVHPDDLSRSAVLLERHFSGELAAYECEARMRHKDGHWVWVLDRGKLFSRSADGRPLWMAGTHQDISERKQAEAALSQSHELLSGVMESLPCGLSVFDAELNLVAANAEFSRLLDLPDKLFEGPSTSMHDIVRFNAEHGEYGEGEVDATVQTIMARARARSGPYVFERDRPNGTQLEIRGAMMPHGGRINTYTDISARRRAEVDMQRSTQLLHDALDALDVALSLFGPDDRLVFCNQRSRNLHPQVADLMVPGTSFETILRMGAERGQFAAALGRVDAWVAERLALHRQGATDLMQRQADGRVLRIIERRMQDGHIVVLRADVTELVRATEAAQAAAQEKSALLASVERSSNLLRGAIDATDEGFVLFDPDDRLVFCNDKYREIYPDVAGLMVPGVSFEALIRPGAEAGNYVEAIGRVDAWVAERLAAHRAGGVKLMQRHANGRALRIIERKLPDGHIVGFRIDITELVQASEAAQAASKEKSQFLANMSHEIRTPMNAILGMLKLLQRTELSTRQADYAAKTEGAARSLLGLLNDILDFSKVEAGKMSLDPQPFRVDQLLRDLSVILSANAGSKRIEVLFDIDPALPRQLVGDAMRLQQVLINLGGNAIKFTQQGEVVVSMALRQRDAAAVSLEIAVRDTGIGIAPEHLQRIFSGFTQAEASTTRRFGGTGLGLAISQRLVALMGGELKVDSAPGQGSRFHFCITLPLATEAVDHTKRAQPAEGAEGAGSAETVDRAQRADRNDRADSAANAEPGPAAPGAALRALVVDDNPTAREVLLRMGESLGWSVDVADSGESALQLLQARPAGNAYQAVFVDWQMPGLDGWQTSQRIRELGRNRQSGQSGLSEAAPVIVMVTAHGREMLAQRSAAEQTALDGFLVKPVTASMLFDAVIDARCAQQQPHPSRLAARSKGQRLAGMRLLVVEDNLNNQQVARELLEDEGATVQLANHGREGVEAVAAADPPFDVVLMDLQMPVMDGFEATRRIRTDLAMPNLPIVAMTANAMASDREACLAAGMNDHVGKPFDLDPLVHVLRKHAGRPVAPEGAAAAVGAGASGQPAAMARFDLPVAVREAAAAAAVDIRAALNRLGGKREVYRRMLRTFVNDLAAMPELLLGLAAQSDVAAMVRLLHTLKGLAATLGATALAAEASRGEKELSAPRPTTTSSAPRGGLSSAAKPDLLKSAPRPAGGAGAPAEASAVVRSAVDAIRAAGPGLAALLQALHAAQAPGSAPNCAPGTASAAPPDTRAALAPLRALAGQLHNADMAATDTFVEIQQRFGAPLAEPLQAIDDAIGALDFERALRHCNVLIGELMQGQPV